MATIRSPPRIDANVEPTVLAAVVFPPTPPLSEMKAILYTPRTVRLARRTRAWCSSSAADCPVLIRPPR